MAELLLLLTLLLGIVSVVWYSRKTGISPMPSSPSAKKAILSLVNAPAQSVIIDAGSGWGGLAVAAAKKFPQTQVIGYELSPLPWLFSLLCKRLFNLKNLSLYRSSFMDADLSQADVLLCYLSPLGMEALETKLRTESSFRGELLSNTFALPRYQPEKQICLNDLYKTPIYLYRL